MSDPNPGRPMDDELEQAYARAQALAGGERGPAARVRANVLAAALEIAAQSAAPAADVPAARPPLTPVAPPVAAVGRGRPFPINLSSWRVRSGAAICAALVVGFTTWRWDAGRHFGDGQQVASASRAELSVGVVPPSPPAPPSDLPTPLAPPVYHALPAPPLAAPPIVVDPPPATQAEMAAAPARASTTREPDLVIAQADRSDRSLGLPPASGDSRVHVARPRPAAAPPAVILSDAAGPAPARAVVIAAAAAPPPAPAPAPPVQLALAAPNSTTLQRVEITGSSIRRIDAQDERADKATGANDAAKKAGPRAAGELTATAARQSPASLHSAAAQGDVATLQRLLEAHATDVDALDAAGRTALLEAVLAQQPGAVRLLLKAGADPARPDRSGLTPQAAARVGASAEIAALLGQPR